LADLNKPGHFYPSIYLASILFALATLVSVIGIKKRDKCINEHGHEEHEAISWKSFVECARTVPQYIGLAFVTFLGIGNIAPIIKLLATDEFHLTEPQFGVLTLRTALIVAALAYPLGHLADWWGKARSVRLGFVMCAVGLWGIPLLLFNHAVREIGFVISAAVVALGFVIAFPAWNALLTTLSDERKRGTVIGAVSAGQGAGVLFGFISGERSTPSIMSIYLDRPSRLATMQPLSFWRHYWCPSARRDHLLLSGSDPKQNRARSPECL